MSPSPARKGRITPKRRGGDDEQKNRNEKAMVLARAEYGSAAPSTRKASVEPLRRSIATSRRASLKEGGDAGKDARRRDLSFKRNRQTRPAVNADVCVIARDDAPGRLRFPDAEIVVKSRADSEDQQEKSEEARKSRPYPT